MGRRGPLRFLAAAVSGQSHQWQQGLGKRPAAHEQSGEHRLENGSQHFTGKQHLFGSAVSPIQIQARRPVAIKAMAATLVRLVYRMLRYGMKYIDQGAKFYEAQHRQRQIGQFKWKAAKLGFHVVEAAA
jgi:hypothetical protein